MTAPHDRRTLEQRLTSVERRLRTQQRFSALCVVLAASFALLSAQRPTRPPVLSVSELEIVDDSGRIAARIGHSSAGGLLEIRGPGDRVTLSATATAGGGTLTLYDDAQRVASRIFTGQYGAQFQMRRPTGETALSLGATRMGGEVSVHGRDGRAVGALRTDGRGRGELEIHDFETKDQKALKFNP